MPRWTVRQGVPGARGKGAAMRVVLRVLLAEFAVTWVILLAGWMRVAAQIRPFALATLRARLGRRWWRTGLGLLIGLPVVAGWPAMFRLSPAWAQEIHGNWLNLAIPWWLLVGVGGAVFLLTELSAARQDRWQASSAQD
ncbi:MAG TPA: hypothetical protein VMH35_17225 [Streptosporangiaceae bacterium]|nr:hypothetical protein [Streptosporangiaceae bacterium]